MKYAKVITAVAGFMIYAQFAAGAIQYRGMVINEIGRRVTGAEVRVRNVNNPAESYTAVTDTTGTFSFDIPTSVEDAAAVPFALYGNFPNPFNPATRISFSLDKPTDVFVSIYNVLGQRIRVIDDGYREPGYHTVVWDGHDDYGMSCAAGVYLYRLNAGGRTLTSRMLMVDAGTGSWISPGATPSGVFKQAAKPLYTVTVEYSEAVAPLVMGPMTLDGNAENILKIERDLTVMRLVHKNKYMRGFTGPEMISYVKPPHPVTITHDFLMDKYETTTTVFCEVMNHALARGAITIDGQTARNVDGDSRILFKFDLSSDAVPTRLYYRDGRFHVENGSSRNPQGHVSWYGAMFYCYERNIMEGREQTIDPADWSVDWDAVGYRLPTDAEWELAAAWTDSREYAFGPDPGEWYPMNTQLINDGFENTSAPVGWYSPQGDSRDGISDMSGNLQEWVYDWKEDYRPEWVDTGLVDPTGPETGGTKVCRGGSAFGCFRGARASDKASQPPETVSMMNGFRTIRVVK